MSDLYYLEYHDAAKNSHKFYAGNPQTGDVLYGRVGAKGTLKHYGFNKTLDMKYEKQKKGYKSASMPQYVEDRLRMKDTTLHEMNLHYYRHKQTMIRKTISANQGLLNWFGSLNKKE